MRLTVTSTDRLAWSVGLSVTLVSPAKMAAPIEMPFGSNTWVGPGNHVLDGGSDPLMERGNFEEEKRCPIVKYRDSLWSFVRKQLNQSRCRLDCGLRWSIRIMLDEGPELLTDIAMATNFGMQFAITGFVAITLVV